jgi:hypothetical protein
MSKGNAIHLERSDGRMETKINEREFEQLRREQQVTLEREPLGRLSFERWGRCPSRDISESSECERGIEI